MKERWKPIPGWELYEISDHGNLRSWKPQWRERRERKQSPRALKLIVWRDEYPKGVLSKYENSKLVKRKHFNVHRLVAELFVPGMKPGLEVAHLDGNKQNSHFKNLSWVTRKENSYHRRLHGTHFEGESHYSAKVCDNCVRSAKRMRDLGFSYQQIGFILGLATETIRKYLKGRLRTTAIARQK